MTMNYEKNILITARHDIREAYDLKPIQNIFEIC